MIIQCFSMQNKFYAASILIAQIFDQQRYFFVWASLSKAYFYPIRAELKPKSEKKYIHQNTKNCKYLNNIEFIDNVCECIVNNSA